MPPWTQLYLCFYFLQVKGALKAFKVCVASKTSSAIIGIKKHGQILKYHSLGISQLLAHSLHYGTLTPQKLLIFAGFSYLWFRIVTWRMRNVTLAQESPKNMLQQVLSCSSVLTWIPSTNYTRQYSRVLSGMLQSSNESNNSSVFVETDEIYAS